MKPWLVVLALAGCADDPLANTAPVTADTARAPCTTLCDRQAACAIENRTCVESCTATVAGWAREDGMAELATCLETLPCEADDDVCAAMVSALDEHRTWTTRCEARLGECQGWSARACGIDIEGTPWFRLIAPAIVDELLACLDGPDCTARVDCVRATIERYHIEL